MLSPPPGGLGAVGQRQQARESPSPATTHPTGLDDRHHGGGRTGSGGTRGTAQALLVVGDSIKVRGAMSPEPVLLVRSTARPVAVARG